MIEIIKKPRAPKLRCPECGYENDINDLIVAGFYDRCLMCGHEEVKNQNGA